MTERIHNRPPCWQFKKACLAFAEGRCKILHDTNFGKKPCPFYKTKAMVNVQLAAAKKERK